MTLPNGSTTTGRDSYLSSVLVAVGVMFCVVANSPAVYACGRSDLIGRVKSVLVSESRVEPGSNRMVDERLAFRIDVSRDGSVEETTLYDLEVAGQAREKITSYFEGGRLVRQIEAADGKTASTTLTCSYDSQGRLTATTTQSDSNERNATETYEYSLGSVRRRALVLGQWKVTQKTLDTLGRVVREVTLDESKSTVEETSEFTYAGNKQEQCSVASMGAGRQCATIVRDSHGNEIEFAGEGLTRKTSFEYDSVGNWVTKRTTSARIRGATVETVVRRKIEYW